MANAAGLKQLAKQHPNSVFAHIRWHDNDYGFQPRCASCPSLTRPGSSQRIRVYESRVEHGQELFHPGDLVLSDKDDKWDLLIEQIIDTQ